MRWFRKVKWFFLIIWLLVTICIIRILAIDSIIIQSPACKPHLQPGDNILVSKIHYGPRLPITYHRFSGFTRIKRGDLLAFNFPEGDSAIRGIGSISYYSLKRKQESENDTLSKVSIQYRPIGRRDPEVSRCAGLPGDTIVIGQRRNYTEEGRNYTEEGRNYTEEGRNYASLREPSYDYLVEVKNRQLPMEFLTRLGLGPSEVQILPGLGYLMPLRADQVSLVKQRPEVTALSAYLMEPGRGDYNIFPHDARYPWNRDNFGPVIVPGKGDSIRLTLLNLCIYQRVIEVYEKNHLEVRQDQIFINGSPSEHYTFKQDYYFVLGDNRHHSRDSRHWGFLPEDHIIGKPVLIWFSAKRTAGQPFRIYWNRIFNTPV
ncbi:MAG: S26 family signal peptidase [Porphyromonadaceae bacterium]|nr:MAG: S26 family signal peptidase [Porphyromonadaceae bacterium]